MYLPGLALVLVMRLDAVASVEWWLLHAVADLNGSDNDNLDGLVRILLKIVRPNLMVFVPASIIVLLQRILGRRHDRLDVMAVGGGAVWKVDSLDLARALVVVEALDIATPIGGLWPGLNGRVLVWWLDWSLWSGWIIPWRLNRSWRWSKWLYRPVVASDKVRSRLRDSGNPGRESSRSSQNGTS